MVLPGGSVAAGAPGAPDVMELLVSRAPNLLSPKSPRGAPLGISLHPTLLCSIEDPQSKGRGQGFSHSLCVNWVGKTSL